ncbi:hypothetical protein NJI34_37845 [Pseudomonas sp. S 311-6]|nr:hypothetical protein [Pseudomonas sp. S 311-6]
MDIDYGWLVQTATGAAIGSGIVGWWFKTTYQARLSRKLEEAKTNLSIYSMEQQLRFSKFHEKQFNAIEEIIKNISNIEHECTTQFIKSKRGIPLSDTAYEEIKASFEITRIHFFSHCIYISEDTYNEITTILFHISSVMSTLAKEMISKQKINQEEQEAIANEIKTIAALYDSIRNNLRKIIHPRGNI